MSQYDIIIMYVVQKHTTEGETQMVVNGYNIAAENISKLILVLMIFLMSYSKPRENKMIHVQWFGIIASFIAINLNINVVFLSNMPDKVQSGMMQTVMFTFLIVYSMILADIFAYIVYFSYGGNLNMKRYWTFATALIVAFLVTSGLFRLTGYLYTLKPDGRADLSGFINLYICLGVALSIVASAIMIIRHRKIPKSLYNYCMVMMPGFTIFLLVQLRWKSIIMSGISYVMPFLIFYILFHASVYDEVSGCQNADALQTRLHERIRMKKPYTAVCIEVPQLRGWAKLDTDKNVSSVIISATRRIENINRKVRIHRLSETIYVVCVDYNDQKRIENLVKVVENSLSESIAETGFHVYYHVVAIGSHDAITEVHMIEGMSKYLMSKIDREEKNSVIISREEHYEEFLRSYKIMQNLIEIRNTEDLDDDRIVCYAQPVYDVKTDSFKSAEVLARMKLDGELISPADFIPVAEEVNCVHVITKIVLNKTCRLLEQIQKEYEFDVVSFNCDMEEISSEVFNEDVLTILKKYNIVKEHIRLELTETMMSTNYDRVKRNMNLLQGMGIHFHLDDFGTGFSNIERVMDCNFKTIKFDKSLLYKAILDERMDELVSYMAEIFRRYRVNIIVEGVENEEQRDYAICRGFDRIQGFFYAKPMPIEEAFMLFEKKRK